MTVSKSVSSVPERAVNLAAARDRHGDRVDRMLRALQVGDPLADAVIIELDELGNSARAALQRGLAEGRASVPDAPPAVDALLAHAETMPAWVAADLLDEGDRTSRSPSIARLLVGTGRLTATAPRRLAETGLWNASVVLPGGLRHGAPGYVQTVQVRLLHARVRASATAHGWDAERWGVPINQADVARTWLDFTVVPFTFLEGIGYRLTDQEQSRLYRYWWYVGHLLGLDEEFFLGIEDHQQAGELLDLLDSTSGAPDENSRALVGALFDAATTNLAAVPQSPLDAAGWRDLLNALAGRYHGEAAAGLGIAESPVTPVLPLLAAGEAKARRYQLQVPGAVQEAVEDGVRAFRGLIAAIDDGRAAYQDHVAAT
jgi:hypothetical protein